MTNLTKREKKQIIKNSLQDINSIIEEYKYEVADMKEILVFKELSNISKSINKIIDYYEKEHKIF